MNEFVLAATLLSVLGQSATAHVEQRVFRAPDGTRIPYGISIPADYNANQPRPLVLALHPGAFQGQLYYGLRYLRSIFSPALKDLGAIMVAPDCPARSWSEPAAEQAVEALLHSVMDEYAIDRRRILVTGYSMGGRGTWYMASRHSDLFTAAIPVAGSPGNEPIDRLGKIPMYVIHSRNDEVSPFAPDENMALELAKLGRPVRFEALAGLGHFEMGGYIEAFTRAGHWVAEQWAK